MQLLRCQTGEVDTTMGGDCGLLKKARLVVLRAFDTRYGGKGVCILSSRAQSRTPKKSGCSPEAQFNSILYLWYYTVPRTSIAFHRINAAVDV
jgi:hypothetical protein